MSSSCPTLPKARFNRFAIGLVMLGLVGCAEIPELDGTIPKYLQDADYPDLVPLDASLTTPATPREDRDDLEQDLSGRVAALQNKARRLNTPVIDQASQERMQTGVAE